MKITTKINPILIFFLVLMVFTSCHRDKLNSTSSTTSEESSETQIEVHSISNCPTGEGCFICDDSKRDTKRLWCKEHDRYEDRCFLCHPEIEDFNRLYCGEHGVYEDECYLCHPDVQSEQTKSPQSSEPSYALMCKEHGVAERECAICQPQLASEIQPGESLKIRIASADSIERVGVEVSNPEKTHSRPAIEAYVTVNFNQNKVVNITPLVEGIIHDIAVIPGQKVTSGDILASLNSPEFAEIKSRFLSANAAEKLANIQVKRERKLADKKISAAAEFETAKAAAEVATANLNATRQLLLDLGLNEKDIKQLISGETPSSLLTLKAPFSGTIIQRNLAIGERIEPGEAIFVLADLSTMWLELSIPTRDAAGLKPGMDVSATFADIPDILINAKLVWVANEVDKKTRRIQARALVNNPPTSLRKGLYGKAIIHLGKATPSLTIPTSAIQTIDGVSFVFVKEEPTLYAATRVEAVSGSTSGKLTAIQNGLNPNDQIVSKGSYILRSEFLKSLLGAGCVDD